MVEADHSLRARIATALVRMGCRPIEAACAEEAWAWAISDQVDLALVSQALPQMTGAELVTMLRASRDGLACELPVIGLAREEVCEQHLASAGVLCFVRSPYDDADLERAVRWVDEVYWTPPCDDVC